MSCRYLYILQSLKISMSTHQISRSLSTEDVAQVVYQQATVKDSILTNTHRAVGLKAKTLMQTFSISPQWLNRLSNSLLAKRH